MTEPVRHNGSPGTAPRARIALVTHSFLPQVGGVEFAVHSLAHAWTKAGHEVVVINGVGESAGATAPKDERGYAMVRYSVPRGASRFGLHRWPFSAAIRRSLEHELYRCAPDFIFVHNAYPCGTWLRRFELPAPSVLTCHSSNVRKAFRGYGHVTTAERELRAVMRFPCCVTAINPSIRDQLVALEARPDPIAVVPNGADLERFSRAPGYDVRQRLGIPADAILVLSVGRNHPDKGLDIGLRAFAEAAKVAARLHYLIVGRNTAVLGDVIRQQGLSGRVTLHEGLYGDDLATAYAAADLFLLPSRRESFPLVVLEAFAAGLAVIATDSGGHRELLSDESTGLLASGDVESEITRALLRLARDPEERRRMGAEARGRAQAYGWDAIAERYLELASSANATERRSM